MKQRFECSKLDANDNETNQTVHIRLDQERGFETERGYDYLTVRWDGYYSMIHGSDRYVPNELKQADWYDTESDYLEMQFTSDGSVNERGFKFDILCKDASKEGIPASKCWYPDLCTDMKNVVITNNDAIGGSFAKEISCLTSSESVEYR